MPKKVSSHDLAVRVLRDLGSVQEIPQRRRAEVMQKLIDFAKQIRGMQMPEPQKQAIAVRAMEAIFAIGEQDPSSAGILRGMANEIRVARKIYEGHETLNSGGRAAGLGTEKGLGEAELARTELLAYEDVDDLNIRDDESKRVIDKDWDWYRWKYYRERKRVDEKYEILSSDLRNRDRAEDEMRDVRAISERALIEERERLLQDELLDLQHTEELRRDSVDTVTTNEQPTRHGDEDRTRRMREGRERRLRDNQGGRLRDETDRTVRETERRRRLEEERMRVAEAERRRMAEAERRRLQDEQERRLRESYDSGSSSYDANDYYNPADDYRNDDY